MLSKLKPLSRLLPIGAGAAVSSAIVGTTAGKRGTETIFSRTASSLSRSSGKNAASAFETAQEFRVPASKQVFERNNLHQSSSSPSPAVVAEVASKSVRPAVVVGHFAQAVRCQPPSSLLHPPPLSAKIFSIAPSSSSSPSKTNDAPILWDNPSAAIFESIVDNESGPLDELVDDLLSYMAESRYVSEELLMLQGKLKAFQWQDRGMVIAEKVC